MNTSTDILTDEEKKKRLSEYSNSPTIQRMLMKKWGMEDTEIDTQITEPETQVPIIQSEPQKPVTSERDWYLKPDVFKLDNETDIRNPLKASGYEVLSSLSSGWASNLRGLDTVAKYVKERSDEQQKKLDKIRVRGEYMLPVKNPLKKENVFFEVANVYENNAEYWKKRADEVGSTVINEIFGKVVGYPVPGMVEFFSNAVLSAPKGAAKAKELGAGEGNQAIAAVVEEIKWGTFALTAKYAGEMLLKTYGKLKVPTLKMIDREKNILLNAIKKHTAANKSQGEAYSKSLGQKFVKTEKALLKEHGSGIGGMKHIMGMMKGEMPKIELKPLDIPVDVQKNLFGRLRNKEIINRLGTPEVMRANLALQKVLTGDLLQRNEILTLRKVFGSDVARELQKQRPLGTRALEFTYNATNFPRAMLASFEMSAPLRQGLVLSVGHPKEFAKAFGTQFKAFFSEQYAKSIENKIFTRNLYRLGETSGLDLTSIGGRIGNIKNIGKQISTAEALRPREEQFVSEWVRYIPGIKQSEQAYVTFLNKLRSDVFDNTASAWMKRGITYKNNPEQFKKLASYINAATGRGELGMLEGTAPFLNVVLFSPRLLAGRVQTAGQFAKNIDGLTQLFSKDKDLRGIIARDMVAFVGTGIGLLTLGKIAWGDKSEIETDPRSTGFGKFRVGNTRVDLWGGYSQLARLVTQMIVAQRKSASGKISEADRKDIFGRFLQTKGSPIAGAIVDFWRGEDFLGNPISLDNIDEQAWNRLMPMFWQDMVDAIRFQGLDGALLTAPGFFGVGAQTYEDGDFTKIAKYKDGLAQATFGLEWDELSRNQQNRLNEYHPEIEDKQKSAKFKSEGVPPIEENIAQQMKVAENVQKRLLPHIQLALTENEIKMPGFARTIAGGFYLNDRRYKQYQDLVVDRLNSLLRSPNMTRGWETATKEKKQMWLKNKIDTAKNDARKRVLILSNYEIKQYKTRGVEK